MYKHRCDLYVYLSFTDFSPLLRTGWCCAGVSCTVEYIQMLNG
jgi:hypothetical protein